MYGNEKIQSVVFNVYDKNSYMYACAILFCCVLVIFVPLYNIANTELLERFKWVSRLVNDRSGDKNRTSLVLFRWTTFLIFSSLALVTDEVTVVLNLAGGLVIPLVSFYLPVACRSPVLSQLSVRGGVQPKDEFVSQSARYRFDRHLFCDPSDHSALHDKPAAAPRPRS